MAKRFVSYEERVEFFDLLCSGLSMEAAAAGSGVSPTAGRGWWRASGFVELVLQMGATGGLPGSAAAREPGQHDPRPRCVNAVR
jgi:IS30 family transposase